MIVTARRDELAALGRALEQKKSGTRHRRDAHGNKRRYVVDYFAVIDYSIYSRSDKGSINKLAIPYLESTYSV